MKKILYFSLLLVLCLTALSLGGHKKASALAQMFPDPALTYRVSGCDPDSCPGSWPVSATVSRAGYNSQQNFTNQLEAPISVMKLYFTHPTDNTAIIESMCHEIWDSPGVKARFTIFQADANENRAPGIYFSKASDDPGLCGPGQPGAVDAQVTVGGIGNTDILGSNMPLVKSTVPGRENFYVAILYVEHDAGGQPGTMSFRVRTVEGGTYATFFELPAGLRNDATDPRILGMQNASAMLDKYGSPAPGSKSQFGLNFAPDCAISGDTETMYLKWFDADWPGFNNNNINTEFYLYDETNGHQEVMHVTGTSSWSISHPSVPGLTQGLGNNNDFRAWPITVTKNHTYAWRWLNVDRNNGIQIWMPYSEINSSLTCAPPNNTPIGNFDEATCTYLSGWAVDPDNGSASVYIQVFRDNEALPFYSARTSEYRPDVPYSGGGERHGFVIPLDQYKDKSVHTYHVFALDEQDGSKNLDMGTKSVGPCAATMYISKYEPQSAPANGLPSMQASSNAVNDTETCIENQGGFEFDCNINYPNGTGVFPSSTGNIWRKNGWRKENIWALPAPNNPYKVNIYVPQGYTIDHASNNGSNLSFTCLGPNSGRNGTEKCVTNGVTLGQNDWRWIDIWFKRALVTTCNSLQLLNPNNSNSPFGVISPEIGQPITVGFSAPIGVPPGLTIFRIDNIAISPGGLNGLSGSYGPASVGSNILVNNVFSDQPNNYHVTYTVHWSGGGAVAPDGQKNCDGYIKVTQKPYLRVYGNDVKAGGGLSPTCTPTNSKATILTYDDKSAIAGNQQTVKGSATEFGAFALGEIDHFVSAGGRARTNTPANSPQARPLLDLTFGNYDPAGSIQNLLATYDPAVVERLKVQGYGGVADVPLCVKDYYGTVQGKATATSIGNTVGAKTISAPTVEYRDGDVQITGNIDFGGTWQDSNGTNNIPSYYLVVRGDIYIQAGVDHITGVFVAQPRDDGTGGRIYTCGRNLGLYSGNELHNACDDKQLTIYGAFIAKQVKFQRTANSLRDGSQGEGPTNSKAAEIFDFSPETYLATPDSSLGVGSKKVQYNFITSLPPIL